MIGRPHLDAVEARLPAAPCGLDETLDGLFDLGLAHGMAAVAVVIARPAGRRPVRVQGIVGIAMGADMVELLDHHSAFRLGGFGQPAKMRDDLFAAMAKITARQNGSGMNRHRFHHDHRRPAERPFPVIGDMLVGRQTVFRHVGGMGAEDDPVAQFLVAQRHRLEHMSVGHRRAILDRPQDITIAA